MNLDALDCFVKIAEVGSLSAASKLHGLPKSTLSLKLRQLEAELDIALFARRGRSLVLTDAGDELLKHARAILASCETAEAAVAEMRDEVAGTLRIGATGEFGTAFNAQMLYAFRQKYPRVKLDLVFFSPSVLFTPDRLQSFDAIISWDDPGQDGYPGETLSSATFALFASRDYLARAGTPGSPEALAEHRGVLYRTPMGLQSWRLQRDGKAVDVLPRSDFAANDYWTIKYFAVAGEGIAYLPKFFTRIECERGHLVPILPGWASEEKWIHIRFPRSHFVSKKASAFLEFCKAYFLPGFEFAGPRYYVETVLAPERAAVRKEETAS
jgi:DNA-binding transcriptional LysR family regulator